PRIRFYNKNCSLSLDRDHDHEIRLLPRARGPRTMSGAQREIAPTFAVLPPLPSATAAGREGGSGGPARPTAPPPSTPPSSSSVVHRTSSTPSSSSAATPGLPNPDNSSPRLSSHWESDARSDRCSACHSKFDALFKRRHHCRLCGRLFCHDCSDTRSLIPPSALVLREDATGPNAEGPSFNNDGDASVTYVGPAPSSNSSAVSDDAVLYGRGLERRVLLARHPQRTCAACRDRLAPLQEELCLRNSNAMRYNYVDEGDALRRLCNSPLAFTLGHEVRKAAYTLGNLLPGNSSRGRGAGFVPTYGGQDSFQYSYPPPEADPCHIPNGGGCRGLDPTLRNLDKVHIPAKLLRKARGVAVITTAKGGLGFAGFEFGTGLVVARRRRRPTTASDVRADDNAVWQGGASGGVGDDPDDWSAPCAIGMGGIAWGALVGAQVSDHVFLLMTDDAVRTFASEGGKSIQLGADVAVAVGPLGRSAEADVGATAGVSRNLDGSGGARGGGVAMAGIYSYSLSKGLYAGVSLDGRVVATRDRVNEKFYGRAVTSYELLSGAVPAPPAAQPLYDALRRCRVYGGGGGDRSRGEGTPSGGRSAWVGEYGEAADVNGSELEDRQGSGGLMERLSHATGAGMPTSSPGSRFSPSNLYDLSGRAGDEGRSNNFSV
ncbi:hypothetical protein ACHAWF_012557, partial [Thalassiosira exigua]